jgi:flagellar motility protein MotE (MotC chaperone)
MSGYDQFFKQARQAKGGPQSKPQAKASAKAPIKKTAAPSTTPEERLRSALANRIQSKKRQAMRRKQEFPKFAAVCVILTFLAGSIGYFRPELLDEAMGHIEVGAFGRAQAAEKEKPKAAPKPEPKKDEKKADEAKPAEAKPSGGTHAEPAKPSATNTGAKAEGVPDVKNWSEEELSFFKKLNERKQELDQREAELTKLDEELQKQKTELDEKIKKLESMRTQISQTLKTRVANDQEKVDKLVQFYSTMKPQQAAKVIESINEDLAVEVLDKMKKKNAAEIMNMIDAKKARRLSELLTGYERTPASEAKEKAEEE